jgi:integrase
MTSWRGYPPYGEDRTGKRVPMTSRAAVRFVVRFRSGDSTTAPRRRSFATAPEAREFFRLLRRADAAGWPTDADGLPQDPDATPALSGDPSVVEPMSEPVAAPALRGRSFTEYVESVFWPAHAPIWQSNGNLKGAEQHATNLELAAKLLVYRDGDPRVGPATPVGSSMLLADMTSDDVALAVAGRARTNARTTAWNARERIRAEKEGRPPRLRDVGASPTTVRSFEVSLGMVLRAAKQAGLLTGDPLSGRRLSRTRNAKVRLRLVHTPDEVWKIADAIATIGWPGHDGHPTGMRYRALVAVAGFAPLRPGELCALGPHDAELEDDSPVIVAAHSEGHVRRRFAPDGRPRQRKRLKHRGEGEHRIIPLPPDVAAALREHIAAGYASDTHLFTSPNGQPLDLRNFGQLYWRPACEKAFANGPRAVLATRPFKWLRKTAITYWLHHLGKPVHEVAHYAGVTPAVIFAAYAGLEEPDPRAEASRLPPTRR